MHRLGTDRRWMRVFFTTHLLMTCIACGPVDDLSSDDVESDGNVDAALWRVDEQTYDFHSRFDPDNSSVAYIGQATRQLMVQELKGFIGRIEDADYIGAVDAAEIAEDMLYFFDYKNVGGTGAEPITISSTPPLVQATLGDVGAPVSLREKTRDIDLDNSAGVIGLADNTLTASAAAEHIIAELSAQLYARANGNIPSDPVGNDIAPPYVTAAGVDLRELLQKYLDGAVAFSQAADDYLDDDIAGKGILSDNTIAADDGAAPYTALEHAWDEAFGYFGASRDWAKRDLEARTVGPLDTSGDDAIDWTSEMAVGSCLNAAKRDLASGAGDAATQFASDAIDAFLQGRALITSAGGQLSESQLSSLRAQRDQAINAWERAIAASALHYINQVLRDMAVFGTEAYVFVDHAKHWAELKGFALALNFNPRSPINADSQALLVELHALLGNAPVLPSGNVGDIADYQDALRDARALLAVTYGFHGDNVGDDDGNGGW